MLTTLWTDPMEGIQKNSEKGFPSPDSSFMVVIDSFFSKFKETIEKKLASV